MASFIIDEDEYLAHYGILRRSGRYPWGSGEDQLAIYTGFLATIEQHKKDGLSQVEIGKLYGLSTTELRNYKTIATGEVKAQQQAQAQRLKDKGNANTEIGRIMGINESTVRSLLQPGKQERTAILKTVSDTLRKEVEDKGYIDVGKGVENHIGVSKERLVAAIRILRDEGYKLYYYKTEYSAVGQKVTRKVLAKKDLEYKDIDKNDIRQISFKSNDYGRTFDSGVLPPIGINKNRVDVVYGPEGGAKFDGVMFIRPGVKDVSIGNSNYAQVRVLVGKSHYIKGMAIYKEDLPEGVDIQFNTNKERKSNKLDALKPVSDDPSNPFGAQITRQLKETDRRGTEKLTSVMNIVNDEGDWFKWSKSLSSQVLSKQSPSLAKTQLDMTFESRSKELEEIMSLTNPTVKKKLLQSYSDDVDSAAVHLKAAALPNQKTHVILPIGSMKSTEIYAPNYQNGDVVALIRYPHGGTFEIPELTVNNKQSEAKRLLGNAKDAVGIHHSVAERLSGADFDGDTVLVIPNKNKRIKTSPALQGLKNFDPQSAYPYFDGMKLLTESRTQREMGDISNLITDMTIKNANEDEVARAVRHSMVVIDAAKHKLNYKQSEVDNGIRNLKEKYQGSKKGGASTLISLAKSQEYPLDRKARSAKEGGPINRMTGAKEFVYTGETYIDRNGKVVLKKGKRSKKLAETQDAFTLSSGTKMETLYADHSNKLKSLANKARLELIATPRAEYSPSARKAYQSEVARLKAALDLAQRNSPLERHAQTLANGVIKAKLDANPGMAPATLKKVRTMAINDARNRVGARKIKIDISPKEWEAIQAGAISDTNLMSILNNADMDVVTGYAKPKKPTLMTSAKTNRAESMLKSGYTRAEVAKALGVSISTLDEATV